MSCGLRLLTQIPKMMRSKIFLQVALLLPLFCAKAQPPPSGLTQKPPQVGAPAQHPGDRRGMMPGFGRPPMRSDEFDKLPEADKKRVREALDKVWSRPEVIEARDRAMRVNEEMRDTIRHSLEKIDPEAAKILAKIEPKDHFDPRQMPPMPATDSEEYPKAMVMRLGMEMLAFAKPDRREETKKFHERIMAGTMVQDAFHELEAKRGEERIQAAHKLRQVYRESAVREFQKLREKRAQEEAKTKP